MHERVRARGAAHRSARAAGAAVAAAPPPSAATFLLLFCSVRCATYTAALASHTVSPLSTPATAASRAMSGCVARRQQRRRQQPAAAAATTAQQGRRSSSSRSWRAPARGSSAAPRCRRPAPTQRPPRSRCSSRRCASRRGHWQRRSRRQHRCLARATPPRSATFASPRRRRCRGPRRMCCGPALSRRQRRRHQQQRGQRQQPAVGRQRACGRMSCSTPRPQRAAGACPRCSRSQG